MYTIDKIKDIKEVNVIIYIYIKDIPQLERLCYDLSYVLESCSAKLDRLFEVFSTKVYSSIINRKCLEFSFSIKKPENLLHRTPYGLYISMTKRIIGAFSKAKDLFSIKLLVSFYYSDANNHCIKYVSMPLRDVLSGKYFEEWTYFDHRDYIVEAFLEEDNDKWKLFVTKYYFDNDEVKKIYYKIVDFINEVAKVNRYDTIEHLIKEKLKDYLDSYSEFNVTYIGGEETEEIKQLEESYSNTKIKLKDFCAFVEEILEENSDFYIEVERFSSNIYIYIKVYKDTNIEKLKEILSKMPLEKEKH